MEIQKVLKLSKGIVILCDYREQEITSYLKEFGAVTKEVALEIGDFVCSQSRVIERKSGDDFIASIISGRIFEQARALKQNFERPLMIVEGWSERRISEDALTAAIATLIVDFNLSLIRTRNRKETAKVIYWIARKEQEEKKGEISFKLGKKPRELRLIQEKLISMLPGVGKVLSKRLLERFKSPQAIFTASEEELRKVKGVSKATAKKIREILTLQWS